MRLTRQSRACPILVAGLIALGACMPTDPPTSARTSPSRSPAPPQPAETAVETKVIERRLNFVQGAGTRGALRYQIPYGRGPGHVYFADYCVPPEDCAPPCPCEVPAVPTAFDIDDKSRLWVYDTASARLAVFGPDGSWRFAVALGEIGYRGGDIQIVGEDAVALTQDDESRAVGIRIDSDGTALVEPTSNWTGNRSTSIDSQSSERERSARLSPAHACPSTRPSSRSSSPMKTH